MKLLLIITFFFYTFSNAQNCSLEHMDIPNYRSLYNIGDTLTIEDQNFIYPICNGSQEYQSGDYLTFSDLNGNLNGGDYKITIISMNATW